MTCDELQDPMEASRRLVAKLDAMSRRYGDIDSAICHYASGNVCGARGIVYAERHHDLYSTARRLYGTLEGADIHHCEESP